MSSVEKVSERDRLHELYGERVLAVARQIHGQRRPRCTVEDMVQAGWAGLLEANRKFDPSRGFQFWTYAEYRVRGAIWDWLATERSYGAELVHRFHQCAKTDGVLPMDFAENFAAATTLFGLDEPTAEPANPEGALAQRQEAGALWDAVRELPDDERLVIEQHYRGGKQFSEIAAELDVQPPRVSKTYRAALERVRVILENAEASTPAAPSPPPNARSRKATVMGFRRPSAPAHERDSGGD